MHSRIISITLITALFAGLRPVAAQGYFEMAGFGSYTEFDRSLTWDHANSGGVRFSFGSGAGLGTFVLEAEGAYFSLKDAALPTTTYIPARARLLYAPTFGRFSLLLGGGGVRNHYHVSGAGSGWSTEWGYTALAGMRLGLGDYLALRVEGVLDYMPHPANGSATVKRTKNRAIQAGLSVPLWSKRPAPRPERVATAPVRPPAPTPTATPTSTPPKLTQAPESRDRNPRADADRDGVPDGHDQCSGTAPGSMVDESGCPVFRDSDGDGVVDQRDACSSTPAGEAVDGKGCSLPKDSDGDGVADTRDRCANTPAGTAVMTDGCPPPAADGHAPLFRGDERVTILRGVNFKSGQAELTPDALAVLDDVALRLMETPSMKVEIGGHTDSVGGYTRNLRLSLARAEAVRAYLILRGVSPSQLTARGYGPSRPIAGNGTAIGRAMNRRVELRRIE